MIVEKRVAVDELVERVFETLAGVAILSDETAFGEVFKDAADVTVVVEFRFRDDFVAGQAGALAREGFDHFDVLVGGAEHRSVDVSEFIMEFAVVAYEEVVDVLRHAACGLQLGPVERHPAHHHVAFENHVAVERKVPPGYQFLTLMQRERFDAEAVGDTVVEPSLIAKNLVDYP